MRAPLAILLILASFACGTLAWAHVAVKGLGRLTVDGERVTYSLTIVVSEIPLASAAAIDAAAAGPGAAAESLAARLRSAVLVSSDGSDCKPGRIRVQGAQLAQGRALLEVDFTCLRTPRKLLLRERWNGFLGEHYGTIVTLRQNETSREVLLDDEKTEAEFDLSSEAPSTWLGFIKLGIGHIVSGFDHLLFLLALLAPAQRLWSVVKIVTAFTLAHSITLSLATLRIVSVPTGIVEPLIAASIVAVAAENLVRDGEPRWRWAIAFAFGLVHGLGFADALLELDLPAASLVPALVGFNLGVEAGQLAVIIVAFPVIRWAAAPQRMPRLVTALSCVVGMGGVWWLFERLLSA